MNTLIWILICVIINTSAQLLLKEGMNRLGHWDLIQMAINPFIFTGLCCYVLSVLVWLFVLSRAEVSYAYPMISLGYIATAFAAYWWLGESITMMRIMGIMVILAGVYLITRSVS